MYAISQLWVSTLFNSFIAFLHFTSHQKFFAAQIKQRNKKWWNVRTTISFKELKILADKLYMITNQS